MPPSPDRLLLLLLLLASSTFLAGASKAVLGKPEIFPNRSEIVLEAGESLNLTCRAAHPVAWCSDHKFTTEHYEELYDETDDKAYISTLTIDAVNTSHVGYFSCVFNTSENRESNNCNVSDPSITSLYLFVKDLENFMVTLQNGMVLHTQVGESVVLPCRPTFPQVNMTLSKNYEPYTCESWEDCSYDPREGFTVWINEEYTHFTCIPVYYDRELAWIDIIIRAQKSLIEKPNQPTVDVEGDWQEDGREDTTVYYVREGTSVNLTCLYQFDDPPSTLKLEWNDNSSNKSGTHRIIRQVYSDTQDKGRYYEINNATMQDSGIYSCQAKKHHQYSDASRLNISVVAKDATYLTTTIFNRNVTKVEKNHPVQWEIIFIAHPEPVFQWKKQDKLLLDSRKKTSRNQRMNHEMKVTVEEASLSLFLHHPKLDDNGKYTLEAFLPGTNITTTTTMFLMIPGKPKDVVIKSLNDNQMFKEGDRFSLTCSAQGYPKPHLTLHFVPENDTNVDLAQDGRGYNELREDSGMDEDDHSSMVKRSVHWIGVAQHPGSYLCKAENDQGQVYSSSKKFLVTDGESLVPIALRLEIGGEVRGVMGNTATVVEGDDFKLTCRANKVTAKAPLTWTLNNNPLDQATRKTWAMEVTDNDTRLSLVSTVRATSLPRSAGNFSIRCADQAGNHTDIVINLEEMVQPEWRGKKDPGKDYNRNKNDNLTLSCPADGTPRPKVTWKKGQELVQENNWRKIRNNYELFFEILSSSDTGKYTCEISNRAGNLSAFFNVTVNDPDDQKTLVILSIVGVLIVALVVMSVFLCRRIYQARKETLNLQLREQKMFIEGDPSSLNPDIPLEQQAELLPYNTKYEVSRDSIIFDKLLGTGAFGRVYRATALNLQPGEPHTTVAVKMMKSRTDCSQLKALRSEVKIMIHIGRHANIVNLLGACSKDLASKGELLLLVEYCKHGNILDYMRRHRRDFVNQINAEDKIDPTFREPRPRHRSDSSSRSHTSHGLKYTHLNFHQDNVFYGTTQASDGPTATSPNLLSPAMTDSDAGCRPFRARTVSASSTTHHMASDNSFLPCETSTGTSDGYLSAHSLNTSHVLCSTNLLEWAYQIAKGMEYLAFKKVLHGDLAARNVLLAENNVVKISDFGLAKDIYKNNNYKKVTNGPVPVKWLAVECLRDGVFSTQSDVWSFGVVLWEIFSLGQIPYSCSEFDESFILKLEKGIRLEQPRYSTYGLYRLMLECWNTEPMERPSFTSLEASLGDMLGEVQRQNYLQLTEAYEENASSEFLDLLASQDYSAKMRQPTPLPNEDGYEMPFSPGVAPQLTVQADRLSTPTRLTNRQKEYLCAVEGEHSASSYVPMSADRTDAKTVFDFDDETVACIMGRPEKEEYGNQDLYLRMDKPSPEPHTPDAVNGRQHSPRRTILKSISSQGSQRGRHRQLTKHDSGVYSPTVLAHTNPEYLAMSTLLSTDDHNYIDTGTSEANGRVYANLSTGNADKARQYVGDTKCAAEYANLIPQDSGCDRTESDTSSGVDSIEGSSPPRGIEIDKFNVPPIPEEALVV